jgi:hypothetical protein
LFTIVELFTIVHLWLVRNKWGKMQGYQG